MDLEPVASIRPVARTAENNSAALPALMIASSGSSAGSSVLYCERTLYTATSHAPVSLFAFNIWKGLYLILLRLMPFSHILVAPMVCRLCRQNWARSYNPWLTVTNNPTED